MHSTSLVTTIADHASSALATGRYREAARSCAKIDFTLILTGFLAANLIDANIRPRSA